MRNLYASTKKWSDFKIRNQWASEMFWCTSYD